VQVPIVDADIDSPLWFTDTYLSVVNAQQQTPAIEEELVKLA
jgi:hypothetical protein